MTDRDRVNTTTRQDSAVRRDELGADARESKSEFEFSRLVVGEQVPFEPSPMRIERTWARLQRSLAETEDSKASRRVFGPALALAACAATFAAGVWVGSQKSRETTAHVVSAEPVTASARVVAQSAGHSRPESDRNPPNDGDSREELSEESVRQLASAAPEGRERPVGHPAVRVRVGRSPVAPTVSAPVEELLPPVVATSNVAVSSAGWQRLANSDDYEAALQEIDRAGGFEKILETATAEQLMLLSDVARATGQQQRALAALRRIVNQHTSDPVAPLAALNMGNLLDKMGDGAGATEAFAVYRRLSPQGDFAEDALVRQIRSAVSAGQQELARRLVRQYEADFPEGRRADEVARWAEKIPNRVEAHDAGVPNEAP